MTTLPTRDLIPLPHQPRELSEIVEPGQNIPGHRDLYAKVTKGELPMIIFDRGRWKCPRPELPALAEALGLRLKPSSLPPAAKPNPAVSHTAKPKPATSKAPHLRSGSRRSAA